MGCRGVWHMYASEGVYVIPRAKPEELHNTRGCMHMPYTTTTHATAHLCLNYSRVAHPSHALYTPLWVTLVGPCY